MHVARTATTFLYTTGGILDIGLEKQRFFLLQTLRE